MKKSSVALLALALLVIFGGASWLISKRRTESLAKKLSARPSAARNLDAFIVAPPPLTPRVPISGLSNAEKLDRIERIKRDYDEITAKSTIDYSTAGDKFPGGVNAFMRQLALLAREKHADLAAFLTPRELEDLEMRDSGAGQKVMGLLGNTAATDEQRRAVFELQKAFEDKFALTFDLTPPVLLVREMARQETVTAIRGVLGDELFGAWLRGDVDATEFAAATAFAQQAGLAASVPLDLWRVKNDFILARLELRARTDLSLAQLRDAEAGLVNQATTRVNALIGSAAVAKATNDMLGWLPRAPAK